MICNSKVVKNINYTDELIESINQYNHNLDLIISLISSLKITNEDINMRSLCGLLNKLVAVKNNIMSRKEIWKLLKDVINEYGYMLEVELRGGENN